VLRAADVVRCRNLNGTYDRVHHRGDVLAGSVGMIQSDGVAELMDKDTANFANGKSI
jgi:hypothetical protein